MDKEKAKNIFKKVVNKYTITIAIFLFFLFMGEKHNAIQRIEYKKKINALEKEIDYYKSEIERKQEQLKQLESDNKDLEKFAREHYMMKSPDEDIFQIKE